MTNAVKELKFQGKEEVEIEFKKESNKNAASCPW